MREKISVKSNRLVLPELSIKAKTMATICAVVMGVFLPQLCHVAGSFFGVKSGLGEMLLPMHLTVLLVGFLAGPLAGGIAGAATPLISFSLTAMPGVVMLPFIVLELVVYGMVSGMVRNRKAPAIAKVLIAQISGRMLRGLAICLSVYAFGNEKVAVSVIFTSIVTGAVGICLQWVLIPLVLRFAGKESFDE